MFNLFSALSPKSLSLVVMMLVFGVAGYTLLSSTFAADPCAPATAPNVKVCGRVYDSRTGNGIPNVVIFTCLSNPSAKTDSNGYWKMTISVGTAYCARVQSGIPSGYSGPVIKLNSRPGLETAKTYEFQRAGKNCYQNSTCNANDQKWDRSIDTDVDFKYTSPAPPAPTPTPTPAPTPTPTPTPKTTPKSTTTTTPKPTTTTQTTDTAAPSTPANFKAEVDSVNKSVKLSWDASSDNVSVSGYALERSTDSQQVWEPLGGTISQTSYEDSSAGFNTTYFYRLKAIDGAGNVSDYAATQVTTTAFEANASKDSESSITSEDKLVTVTIPAGALSEDAFCSIVVSADVLPPTNKNQTYISGPYEVNCRGNDGQVITNFSSGLVLSANVSASQHKGVKQVVYYGYDDNGSWSSLKVTKHDKSSDTVELSNHRVFAIMGQQKKTPLVVRIFIIFIILAIFIVLVRYVVRLILKRKAQSQYSDYLRKSKGL